jgi:hypothetical protein
MQRYETGSGFVSKLASKGGGVELFGLREFLIGHLRPDESMPREPIWEGIFFINGSLDYIKFG